MNGFSIGVGTLAYIVGALLLYMASKYENRDVSGIFIFLAIINFILGIVNYTIGFQ